MSTEQAEAKPPKAPPSNVIALSSQGNYERWMIDTTLQLRNTRPNASLFTDILARVES